MHKSNMALTETDDLHDPLLAEAAQLRASRAFSAAVREYTVAVAHFRETPRLLNKVIASETRLRLGAYVLSLASDHETYGPLGGATFTRLLELCEQREELSPRILKTTLALLKLTGFVRTTKNESDGRSKTYQPTARWVDFVKRWLPHAVNALDALQPDMQRARMFAEDPDCLRRFLASAGREHMTGIPLIDRMPEFTCFFGKREGGIPVVLSVMQSDIDGTPLPSRAQVAKRFGLSKTQISKIIAEGTSLGFFTIDDAGVPVATAYLRDSYTRFLSIELAFYARHMQPVREGTSFLTPGAFHSQAQ
jgi:DNA-binding PadR family transcriptional regulator